MNKIIFFTSSMGRGGAERVISILAREYCSAGWNVSIVMLLHDFNEYKLDERVRVVDLSHSKTGNPVVQKVRMLRSLRQFIKKEKPDIMVPFLAKIAALTELALLGVHRSFRMVASERIDPYCVKYSKPLRRLIIHAFHHADAVVFQSKRAQSYYDAPIQAKSLIIGNPVSLSLERHPGKIPIVVTAGRLAEQKNQKILVNAFSKIAKDFQEWKLQIFGEGPLREELQEQIRELNLQDRILLMGNRIDYPEYLAEAAVFVLPSDYEGLSNALLEAMMLGLPCISTACAGSGEVIENGVNGLLTPIGDAVAMADAMRCLLTSETLRESLGAEAKKSAQSFKTENVIAAWKGALEGIIT